MTESFNLQQVSSELACHYTKLATACEYILPSKTIRFSPMKYLNDPRENKARDAFIVHSTNIKVPFEMIDKAPALLIKSVLEYSKLFCTTVDAEENIFDLNTKRCFGRSRMWAQYGDNHCGICLVFDRERLTAEISNSLGSDATLWADRVKYDDWLKKMTPQASSFDYDFVSEKGLENTMKDHIANYRNALFFRKDSDWSGEGEWRWVIHRRQEGYEHLPFSNSLKAIVMGVDSSESYVPSLRSLAGDVPLFHLEWNHHEEDFRYFEI